MEKAYQEAYTKLERIILERTTAAESGPILAKIRNGEDLTRSYDDYNLDQNDYTQYGNDTTSRNYAYSYHNYYGYYSYGGAGEADLWDSEGRSRLLMTSDPSAYFFRIPYIGLDELVTTLIAVRRTAGSRTVS